jgi:hypothetical protein
MLYDVDTTKHPYNNIIHHSYKPLSVPPTVPHTLHRLVRQDRHPWEDTPCRRR